MAFAITDKVMSAEKALKDAGDQFGAGAVFTTSFGLEGSVILHLIAQLRAPIRIVTLDTGLFFAQTYATWTQLANTLQLKIESIVPELSLEAQAQTHGPELWRTQPNKCCDIRKVQPLSKILSEADAWITGIRREQTPERADAPLVGHDERFNVVKINPLVDWSEEEVRGYLTTHNIPYNPLFDNGYPSIGCAPCTQKVVIGGDPRSGRWQGFEKRECGLHWEKEPTDGTESPA
ncbi:MAG: phosphoadenylyl-sulfate reductase [Myxococcales bacterium]|nr:phosphoadenylyl-sulfate reductase [Myxococcales bacterium]